MAITDAYDKVAAREAVQEIFNIVKQSGHPGNYLYDSGRRPINSFESNFECYDTQLTPVLYRRIGNVVYLSGACRALNTLPAYEEGSTTSVAEYDMFALPEGYRPKYDAVFLCQGSGSGKWCMVVHTDGRVTCSRYSATTRTYEGMLLSSGYVNIVPNTWMPFCVSYDVDHDSSSETLPLTNTINGRSGTVLLTGTDIPVKRGSTQSITDILAVMLIPILRECLYGTDQSDALDTLEAALSVQMETFAIQNVLTNVTSSNSAAMIISGAAYHAVLTPDSGTEMVAVTVTMGGVDVTASAYANGVVSISSVTGDVVITATAQSVIDTITPELIDGYISPTTGTIGGTSSYRHTAVIPVREGDKVYGVCDDSQSGATVNGIPARWTAVYDNNGTFLSDSGIDTQSNYKSATPYIVPSGVYGVVFSLTNRYANNVVVTIDKSERVVS